MVAELMAPARCSKVVYLSRREAERDVATHPTWHTSTRYDGVVKLRYADAPALLVTARGATPGGLVQMQPQYTPAFVARFWKKVDRSGPIPEHRPDLGPCWLWTASLTDRGYGKVWSDGAIVGAHRVSWMIAQGAIPDGLWVLHACDVRRCVRPSHLFLGTAADNNADMHAKGRANHDPEASGSSKLTWEQVGEIRESVAALMRDGLSCHEAARHVALERGLGARGVYAIARGWRWKAP